MSTRNFQCGLLSTDSQQAFELKEFEHIRYVVLTVFNALKVTKHFHM